MKWLGSRPSGLLRDLHAARRVLHARIPWWQWNLTGPVPGQEASKLLAGRILWHLHRPAAGLGGSPGLCRPAGDNPDVILRLLRKRTFVGEPILNTPWPRIVRSGSKAKIAELLEQITQQAPRCRYRLQRIERIIEAAVVGRLRHELRDAERAGRADHVRSETAFLIEQTNEKMRRQIVAMCGLSERVADFLARAVNDWLEKGMKCLQWQYDSFVAGRQ